MKRRTLTIGLGCTAGLLAGLSAYQLHTTIEQPPPNPQVQPQVSFADLLARTNLTTPSGEAASLPLGENRFLLNFWATWCPPCIHEMPLLDQVASSELQIYGLAVDELAAVQEFVSQYSFGYPLVVAGLDAGLKLARAAGNTRSAMPYSVMVEADGSLGTGLTGSFSNEQEIIDFFTAKSS